MKQVLTLTNNRDIKAFQQEKYYKAIAIWHEALKIADADQTIINDDYSLILFNKARAYEKVGCLYLAQKGYHEVLKKDFHHVKAKESLKSDEKLLESFKLETLRNNVKQFIMLEGQSNNETKITILKEIEQIEYGALVRQFAYKKTAEEVKNLVIVLKDIGYLTTKLGELSGELKYYTEAAVFYQYIITILDEKLNEKLINIKDKNEFIKQESLYPHQQLTNIQQLIFLTIGGNQKKIPVVHEEAKTNKELLLKLRDKTDEEIQKIEDCRQQSKTDNQKEKYVNTARQCFKDIADEMKKFLAKLYSDSENAIGTPPCKYAVMGLGSMALQQMTPYSDLEFAILTENEDYKHSSDPKIREYFKNLSYLVNFKVINLGESIIPTSKYGLDMSHLVHRAVNLDLGGKTPLGRVDNDKPYELIRTADDMLWYVYNKGDKASHIDKNLPYILENVCYVYGAKDIVGSYQSKVTKFLYSISEENDQQNRLNCEIRALKILKEGYVELDYLQQAMSLEP
ncbi:DUF294 nucleotidyltransferase-like domain-containing protein [Rickettsia endosymbiont of Polydrusus tereticollis]|uniref:DUF294 nucleotidyltransferase-like domain-containing protein n=1 Tax=Rickettsia endosymbiont of Polydrusus tereticollis TaxID=3066251 RepID=UPI003133379A